MVDLNQAGKNLDLITLTTLPDLDSFGGMSYLSELLSFANIEKFDEVEELIIDGWKQREKRNILTMASEHGDGPNRGNLKFCTKIGTTSGYILVALKIFYCPRRMKSRTWPNHYTILVRNFLVFKPSL